MKRPQSSDKISSPLFLLKRIKRDLWLPFLVMMIVLFIVNTLSLKMIWDEKDRFQDNVLSTSHSVVNDFQQRLDDVTLAARILAHHHRAMPAGEECNCQRLAQTFLDEMEEIRAIGLWDEAFETKWKVSRKNLEGFQSSPLDGVLKKSLHHEKNAFSILGRLSSQGEDLYFFIPFQRGQKWRVVWGIVDIQSLLQKIMKKTFPHFQARLVRGKKKNSEGIVYQKFNFYGLPFFVEVKARTSIWELRGYYLSYVVLVVGILFSLSLGLVLFLERKNRVRARILDTLNRELESKVEERTESLKETNAQLKREVEERKAEQSELEVKTAQLKERMKELRGLYRLSQLISDPPPDRESFYVLAAALIPPSWQYPSITCGRITIEGKSFSTENFRETEWSLSEPLQLQSREIGTIEVFYLEEKAEADLGPFLTEEKDLLESMAQLVSQYLERTRAEESLKESERRFRLLADNARDVIYRFRFDPIGYDYISPSIVNLLGYQPEVFFEEPSLVFELVHPDDAHILVEEPEDLKGREWKEVEYRIYNRQGEIVWVEERNTLLRDEEGQAIALQGIVRDITDRKEAEEALRESEERFRRTILEVPFPLIVHADDGETIILSREWTEISGYSISEIPTVESWVEKVYQEKRREKILQGIRELHSLEEKTEEGDFVIATKGGEKRIWRFSSTPLGYLPDGRHLVLSMAVDITEQKKAQEALRESEARFREIATNIPGLVYQFLRRPDGSYEVSYVSDQTKRLFGLSPQEILGPIENFFEKVSPDDLQLILKATEESAQTMENFEEEFRVQLSGGEIRWLLGRSTPRRLKDGSIRWNGVIIDITDQHDLRKEQIQRQGTEYLAHALMKANRDLTASNLRLEQANRAILRANQHKSEFLARMSHELRTPLNSILGFGEVLEDQLFGELNEKQLDYIGNIVKSGKHLLALINDVLDLAKVESGRLELDYSTLELEKLALEGIQLIQGMAGKKSIEVALHPGPKEKIEVDGKKFKQILFNLLSNGIKFSPPETKVELGWKKEDESFIIWVKDQGIGISKEDQKKLFRRFQQIDSSLSREYEGTGLGLALTKTLVHLHGGEIWLESEEGKGSTFFFSLPQEAQPQEITAREVLEEALDDYQVEVDPESIPRPVISISEKEEDLEEIKAYLTRLGFEVEIRDIPPFSRDFWPEEDIV